MSTRMTYRRFRSATFRLLNVLLLLNLLYVIITEPSGIGGETIVIYGAIALILNVILFVIHLLLQFVLGVPMLPMKEKVGVFISYRREDSADITDHIYEHLVAQLGKERIYKDVDSIPPAVNFRTHIQSAIASADVVLAVIGRSWLMTSSSGKRRIDEDDDFVRIELETALKLKKPVIPVLVGGAQLPRKAELPPTIAELVDFQVAPVRRNPDFRADVERIVTAIKPHLRK